MAVEHIQARNTHGAVAPTGRRYVVQHGGAAERTLLGRPSKRPLTYRPAMAVDGEIREFGPETDIIQAILRAEHAVLRHRDGYGSEIAYPEVDA